MQTRSKLFHAIVLAGSALAAEGCNSGLAVPADAAADAAQAIDAAVDLAGLTDASSSGDLAGCYVCPGWVICPSPCPPGDVEGCWPCFI